MSQFYDLFVADESDAKAIFENRRDKPGAVDVDLFDEPKHLSLLSLFKKIEKSATPGTLKFYDTYHRHFRLLIPVEFGKECFVSMFPDDFVQALAETDDRHIATLSERWIEVECGFEEIRWNASDVESLLSTIVATCRSAIAANKRVLYRVTL